MTQVIRARREVSLNLRTEGRSPGRSLQVVLNSKGLRE